MSEVTVRWPCQHGYPYSHYLKPGAAGKWRKCEEGHNVVLSSVGPSGKIWKVISREGKILSEKESQ